MRRASKFLICLLALGAGAAVPIFAFAQESPPAATSTTAPSTTTTGGASTAPTSTTTTGPTSTTTTGETTSASGTGSSGDSKDKDKEDQGIEEILVVLLALILLLGCLYAIDWTLLGKRRVRIKPAAPSKSTSWVTSHPVPRFLLLGNDERWSISRTLASVWTFTLLWSILTLALCERFGLSEAWDKFADQPVSWQYLLLLGGPVAAAIGAQALAVLSAKTGEVKTTPPEGATFSQIYTDDEGKLDLIDVQYLAFNALSIVVFLVVFLKNVSDGLPEFPGILAALTTATTGAYLARKAALRKPPTITSIAPPAASPGELVRLWGINLTPAREAVPVKGLSEENLPLVAEAEAEYASIDVFFDGIRAPEVLQASGQASDLSEAFDVRVPHGAAIKESVQVVVNSRAAQGNASDPYTNFKIVGPSLTTIKPSLARAGTKVMLWGTKLKHGDQLPEVFFDDVPAEELRARPGGDPSQDVIEVRIPQLATGSVKVKAVTTGGLATNELDLDLTTEVRILDAPRLLSLGPATKNLLIKGENFITQLGVPAFAAVFLDGKPLAVSEWQRNECTASLPTDPAKLEKLGFVDKDEAELVVRNDEGRQSDPWTVELTVAKVPEEK